ncbi:ParB/RepB/Spo0J family partition protein [Caproiciproducens galactitolivorans]|uniref:Chromosome-partitioning protein Spo0J n=1 Tax=Caproiciproducens galactitolivorans TaxID=642589 RepID=A0A4Z0XZ57_9FIRM|nr:ParB/RepB/Spo0J family partition protein [Caproiciproducens galactitolivorans]QEY35188.1 ParB/RepB/Spo0J family partition protein [Caproiciproducens galactitolivorans]TGJ76879.1 chromosome-partitioning protein Spo0J [Caproiciproducens galactitolivorans]
MAAKKRGLGKGLDAIFAENDTGDRNAAVSLKISEIEPNRAQPRKDFNEEALAELADSISQHGVLQPLLVRPIVGGYQIVAGERRWRAARMAGISEVPAVIREMTDSEVMQLALIENLQREDLNPIEEAQGYQSLMENYGLTQEEVSKTVGKSRPTVANALRLLNLPKEILDMVHSGKLSAGHARTLLSFSNPSEMLKAAKLAAEQGISVRELEKLAKKANERLKQAEPEPKAKKKPRYFSEVELALNEHLGRKVQVSGTKKRGVLQIEFYGEEDLSELVKLFNNN